MEKYKKSELALMSYDDIAYILLRANERKMKIQTMFKKVCSIKDLDESKYEDKIVDFFQLLTNDKRFIMLKNGYWDLKENHVNGVTIDEEDEEEIFEEEINEDDLEDEEEIYIDEDDDDDQPDDDLADLVIISEEDEENNGLL